MTKEHIKIAVAETIGWKPEMIGAVSGNRWQTTMPDYPSDLNAMHSVENWLEYRCVAWFAPEGRNDSAVEAYIYHLKSVCKNGEWALIGATAAQRSEAFLRTVGKWVAE